MKKIVLMALMFAQVAANPCAQKAYFVFGFSIKK